MFPSESNAIKSGIADELQATDVSWRNMTYLILTDAAIGLSAW